MIFDNFKIAASPFIADAYCKCRNRLHEVPNGLMSVVLYCPKCEDVYELKLVKLPKSKVSEEFLNQCKDKVKSK
jgi:hypothetical protein